jgi:hypothetical protein
MHVMMDINEIRHRNVRMLIRRLEEAEGRTGDRAGGLTMLAAKLGKSSGQVAHFASDKPIKRIGDQIAREIESALGLERGWMDWFQEGRNPATESNSQPMRLNQQIIRGVARAVQETSEELGVKLGIQQIVELAAEMFEKVGESGITTADVVWLVRKLEQGVPQDDGRGGVSDGSRDTAGTMGRGSGKA